MFERYTDRARRTISLAQDEARNLKHNYIGTEHLLLGLIAEGEGVAAEALQELGISLKLVRDELAKKVGEGSASTEGHIPFTPRAKKVLELSLREALQLGHNYIGTEHILLGIIREGSGIGAEILKDLGAELSDVRHAVIKILTTYSKGIPEIRTGVRNVTYTPQSLRFQALSMAIDFVCRTGTTKPVNDVAEGFLRFLLNDSEPRSEQGAA